MRLKSLSVIVSARDPCDYTIDRIRAVTTDRYKYIRNYMTDRPYLQPQYRDGGDDMTVLKELYDQGELTEVQARFVLSERPAEALYELQADPHQTRNLIHNPEYAQQLGELRTTLDRRVAESGDQGQFPESDAVLKAVNKEYDRVRE